MQMISIKEKVEEFEDENFPSTNGDSIIHYLEYESNSER